MVEAMGSEAVRREVEALRSLIMGLDLDAVPAPEAVGLWTELDRLGRLAEAGKLLLARLVEGSEAWKTAGCRSAAEHLARVGGGSVRRARDLLRTSRRVRDLPRIEAALRCGELSVSRAELIADAAAVDPSREAELLDLARRLSLVELARECGRVKAAADPDPESTSRRIHAQRRLRQRVDGEGAWCLSARGTVDVGALVDHALGPLIDEIYEEARAEDRYEHRDAYALDAFVELLRRYLGAEASGAAGGEAFDEDSPGAASRQRSRSNPRHLALIRVDHGALVRGQVEGDELCEISGLGPIPVRTARQLLGDAVLKLAITKGVDVANVTHLGRGPTVAQRMALLWMSPSCANEVCGHSFVQIDHREDWARTRHTVLGELDRLCPHCHRLKTHHGWSLVDGVGRRAFVPPRDPRHPDHGERQPRAA